MLCVKVWVDNVRVYVCAHFPIFFLVALLLKRLLFVSFAEHSEIVPKSIETKAQAMCTREKYEQKTEYQFKKTWRFAWHLLLDSVFFIYGPRSWNNVCVYKWSQSFIITEQWAQTITYFPCICIVTIVYAWLCFYIYIKTIFFVPSIVFLSLSSLCIQILFPIWFLYCSFLPFFLVFSSKGMPYQFV